MQAGVGFMVLEPSQEKIATILFEYEQTRKELSLRRAEASRLGQVLISAGRALSQTPGYVRFLGDSIPEAYCNPRIGGDYNPEDFDGGKLKALTFEVRELEMKQARLAIEKESLGYSV